MRLRVVINVLLIVALATATFLLAGERVLGADNARETVSAVQATSAPISSELEIVAHLGGQPGPLFGSDGLLLASWDRELSVHSSLPASLDRQGYLMFPEVIQAIRAAAGFAYVLSADERLTVVDLSDPANPSVLDVLSGFSPDVDYEFDSTGRLFVSDEQLSIYDVSDPASWLLLGSYPISGSLTLDASYAYLVADSTLTILDVSNPASPQFAGSFTPANAGLYQWLDIVSIDGYVYLQHSLYLGAAGSMYELIALDVSNPGAPSVVGTHESYALPLAVAGNLLLRYEACPLRDCTKGALELLDVTDPGNPVSKTTLPKHVFTFTLIDQNFYSTGPTGFDVLDFSSGEYLYEAGDYFIPTAVDELVADDNRAVITGNPANLLFSLDVVTPTESRILGAHDLPSMITGLAIDTGMLYVSSSYEFDILNTFPLGDPDLLSSTPITPPLSIQDLAIAGDYAYLLVSEYISATLAQPGLKVVDVSNSAFPNQVDSFDLDSSYTTIESSADRLYLGTDSGKVSIYDLATPQQPAVLGEYVAGAGYRLAGTYGDWFFIVDGDRLGVIDAVDPAQPQQAAAWSAPQNITRVKAFGAYLYVGWADVSGQITGLSVLDLTDPSAPYPFTQYSQYVFEDFEKVGDYLMAAGGDRGLYVFAETYSIQGEVRSENGAPYEGASIVASGAMTVTSGLDGAYTFTQLMPGDYSLSAAVPGFQTLPASQTVGLPQVQYARQFRVLAGPVDEQYMASHEMSMSFYDTQALESSFLFPDNYSGAPVTMRITPTLASSLSGWAFTGHAFELGADDLDAIYDIRNSGSHIGVEIAYSDVDVAGINDESGLVLMAASPDGWALAGEECTGGSSFAVDTDANVFQSSICNPGTYAMFGPAYSIALPFLQR